MNRGSDDDAKSSLGKPFRVTGFNEAPIHESGKWHPRILNVVGQIAVVLQ